MKFRTATSSRTGVQAGMKLARLMEMSEGDFEVRVRELEGDPVFRRLLDTRVISVQPYDSAGFAARRFGGWGLRTAGDGLSSVLDGQGEMAKLLHRVGQERFEECFLRDEGMTDAERARLCKIPIEEAAKLREMVNRLYIQAEFDGAASEAAPPKVYSAVAGVMVEDGRAALAFFNREIWKGRYRVDENKRRQLLDAMSAAEAKRADRILRDLEFLDRRKTTLYRLLEVLLEAQARFFVSGDPDQREPLTQRAVSEKLDVLPSVFNRLISNKSIELPWGLETPLRTLFPSRKSLLRDRLHELIRETPSATDDELSKLLARMYGAKLSCRSIAQYRAELGLGTSRTRR
ncbi:MAG: hypothetical protein A2V88_17985 [Elusimicrobia bacterium RBG_16_66_12]|nr:MAG: hypothetical protein A2V88_17985 [Elusimicrobia bacterium RBG_16_66_12]